MARSLQNCLDRAGKAISNDDKNMVLRLAKKNTELGATRQLMARIMREKENLLDEIEAAGGNRDEWGERLEAEEIDFNSDLNKEGAAIEREFFEFLNSRSWEEIHLMYASIEKSDTPGGFTEDTKNGKVLNADAFRELFDRYRRNRLLADPAHEPSSAGIKKMFAKAIATLRKGDLAVFTAGGPAAGKGQTQERSAYYEDADLVFDGTMSNFNKDDANKIAPLVEEGVRVHIMYAHMDPITAFTGSLRRAIQQKKATGSGRVVAKPVFVNGHVGANATIRQLYEKYKDNPLVTFEFFYNTPMVDANGKFYMDVKDVTLDDIPRISKADLSAQIDEFVGELQATGEIDDETLRYTISSPWREEAGQVQDGAGDTGELRPVPGVGQPGLSQDQRGANEVPQEVQPEVAYSRAASPEAQQNYARMRLALAPAIRNLTGTLNISLLQTAEEVPEGARPADDPDGNTIEGLWLRGTNEAFLVAENMTVPRAHQVLAHEAFGHAAMEQMPEFTKILDSIQNLKSVGNKTINSVAARVASSQPNLDSTTEAKEILATMAEMGIKSTTMDRAITAARNALRRIFGVDLDYNEAEIRQLIVEGARGLQSKARAKRAALAAKPLAKQILEDPSAVEAEIRNAIEEIYAKSVMQDAVIEMHEELADAEAAQDPAAQARAERIRAAIEQMENAPAAAPDVLYQTAYHGTGAPEFDRFDIKYIGTGEGAAAYGWGLYFSSKKAVADWYRRKLTRGYIYGYNGEEGLSEDETISRMWQDLYDGVLKPMVQGNQTRDLIVMDVANTVVAAGLSMFRRYNGSNADVKKELEYQRDNAAKSAETYRQMVAADESPDKIYSKTLGADWGKLGPEGVILRAEATAEAYDRMIELVGNRLTAERRSGTIFKVDVPNNEDLLHWRKPMSEHSEAVRDKILKAFPELGKEQWISGAGMPIPEIADTDPEMNKMWAHHGRPIDRMRGDDLYNWLAAELAPESFTGRTRRARKAGEQLASEKLRGIGIPGHSFTGASSSETNYVIYDDSQVQILDAADDPAFLFSRAAPVLRLEPTDMGGQPDPQVVAAGKLPPGESSRFYWQVAVGAQSKAVNYPRSSWERRYYDQLGELAARKAGEARRGGPEITEQMTLFSRSETGTRKAAPGEPFTVYRFGSGADTLQNKNAGNAASVARRLAVFDDYESPQSNNADADVLSVWEITADEFTDYAAMNAGAGAGQGRGVGRQEMPASQRDPEYQEISYSFGTEGYTARKLKDVPLAEVREMLQQQTGYDNFDMSGSGLGSKAVGMFSRNRVMGDDETEAIRAHVLAPAIEDISLKDRLREAVNRLFGIDWLSVKQGIIDDAAVVESIERGLYGDLQDASISPYKAVLATKNLGSVMAAVMHRGVPVLRDGVFQPRRGRKGLTEIFSPITQHSEGNLLPLWELYAVARRASRLIGEKNPDGTSKEKRMTQEQIDKALALGQQYPEFETAFLEWNKFNQQVLNLAVKTGVINQQELKIWAKNDYVPFYRAMEEIEGIEGEGPRRGGRGVEGARSGIKRLSGEDARIGHVFENMVMNTAYLIDASFRNDAMQRIVMMTDGVAMEKIPMAWEAIKIKDGDMARALMKAGLLVVNGETQSDMFNDALMQVRAMTPDQKEHWSTVFRRVAPTGPDVVSVMMNGKPVYYRVDDPLLLRTVQGMGAHQWGGVMNMFRFSKKLLTSAVTIDPAFMLANFIRDTLSSWVVADTGGAVPPILQALKGAKAAFTEDEDTIKIMMAGAGGGGFYDHNPADVRKMLAKKLPAGQVDSFMNSIITPRGAWRFWQKIGNAAEQANRVAKYRKIIAEGGSAAEAAYAARDILNFSMSGDYAAMKFLVQSVPFLNARIQGLYRLYRGGKENPLGFAYKGASIMAATMALLLRNMDDERYEELPEWDKDTYWHFFIGDEHFRLPKPFEIGAMYATVPERFVRAMSGRDDWELFGSRIIKMFAETLQFNPTPQLVKPVVEQYANRNMFTGAPIVGFTLSNLQPEAQYDHWTSETMREWAEAMPDWAPSWLRSPKRLESAVRGYTGAMGMYVLGAADSVTRRAMGHPDRPAKAIQDYPVITRFWRNPQPRSSKYTTQLYDMMNEADALHRTMNAYMKQGRMEDVQDLLEGQHGKLAARKYLHAVANQMREINNQMKILAYSDKSPEEKKAAMDQLNAAKMKIVRQVAHVGELF